MADLAPFMQAFSVSDLSRGRVVSRSVTLSNGSNAMVDLLSRRAAGKEGETRLVAPGHVRIVFNRGAELGVALGLPAEADIPNEAVRNANAHPDRLQEGLDNQVFDVIVHELTHAIIILERGLPANARHSATFNSYEDLRAASERGRAASEAREVDFELQMLIGGMVSENVSPPADAQILATLRADPGLAPGRVRQWFLDERFGRTASNRASGSNMDNHDLAASYGQNLRDVIGVKIRNRTHRNARHVGSIALEARVEA